MSWSLKVGRLAGIEIYVHFTFFILLLWFIGNERSQGHAWADVWQATAILLGAFFCVVLHELGHALTARQFGIQTRDIVILPIGGVARLERMPRIAWQELLVAVAGPVVSAGIALFIGIGFVMQRVPLIPALEGAVGSINHFWANLLVLNVILVIFNLIPAFPMDGGRVFRSVLSMGIGRLKATKIASFTGQTISLLFIFFGLAYSQWLLVLVGAFIFLAARAEGRETVQESLLTGYRVEQAMFYRFPQLDADIPVNRIIALFLNVEPGTYAVVKKDGSFLGFLDDDDLCTAIRNLQTEGKTVADICTRCSFYLTGATSVLEARHRLQESGFGMLPVLEEGKLVGVFSINSINRLMGEVDACRSINARLNLDNIQRPDELPDMPRNTNACPELNPSVPKAKESVKARPIAAEANFVASNPEDVDAVIDAILLPEQDSVDRSNTLPPLPVPNHRVQSEKLVPEMREVLQNRTSEAAESIDVFQSREAPKRVPLSGKRPVSGWKNRLSHAKGWRRASGAGNLGLK